MTNYSLSSIFNIFSALILIFMIFIGDFLPPLTIWLLSIPLILAVYNIQFYIRNKSRDNKKYLAILSIPTLILFFGYYYQTNEAINFDIIPLIVLFSQSLILLESIKEFLSPKFQRV